MKEQVIELAKQAGFYHMEYRRKDYTLADAFKPQFNWGKRRFSIPANTIGPATNQELIDAARETAPEGYELVRLWSVGTEADQDIYVKQPAIRNLKEPTP